MAIDSAGIMKVLHDAGWVHSPHRDAMVSRDGKLIPMPDLRAMLPDLSPSNLYAFANEPRGRFSPYQKLAMRLNLREGDHFGFDNLHIVEGPNKVFVFIVHDDKAVILEDDPSLFPSDKIVGQIRMIQT